MDPVHCMAARKTDRPSRKETSCDIEAFYRTHGIRWQLPVDAAVRVVRRLRVAAAARRHLLKPRRVVG